MKKRNHILTLLPLLGVVFVVSTAQAQVTATATVTLTVVAAPGVSFTPASTAGNSSVAMVQGSSRTNDAGMTFRSSANVMVQLNASGPNRAKYNLKDGQTRTFTAGELNKASSVEIDYLGS